VLDQRRPHQPAHRLAPVRVLMGLAVLVELLEQLAADGDAEPHQRVFHGHPLGESHLAPRDQPILGISTHAPSWFELATAASTNAMPATPSRMPGCSYGVGTVSPRRARRVHSRVRWRLARASWNPS